MKTSVPNENRMV